jgi:hypothetical protein
MRENTIALRNGMGYAESSLAKSGKRGESYAGQL